MKYSTILLIYVALLLTSAINAQIHHEHQFAHSYGVVTGYEFEKSQIPYDKIPMQSLARGIKERIQGLNTMTEAQAEDIVQTIGDRMEAAKSTTGYNYTTTDFSNVGYAYGVLVGSNWNTYGIQMSASNLKAFLGGVKSVFYDRGKVASRAEAEAVILQRYKALEEEKKTVKLRENKAFLEKNKVRARVFSLENGIQYEILHDVEGTAIGQTDKRLLIKYIGKLTDGTVFEDASDAPIMVTLGSVMAGWKSILPLMREHQIIKTYIPSNLGYGDQARGKVPANSILIYEITLMEILD